MLENPRVTKTKFPANESRLQNAWVVSRCLVKGRIGATIGLVYEDDDGRFTAYTFQDRMIIISEEPDAQDDIQQQAEKEKADLAEKKRQGGKGDDKKA